MWFLQRWGNTSLHRDFHQTGYNRNQSDEVRKLVYDDYGDVDAVEWWKTSFWWYWILVLDKVKEYRNGKWLDASAMNVAGFPSPVGSDVALPHKTEKPPKETQIWNISI